MCIIQQNGYTQHLSTPDCIIGLDETGPCHKGNCVTGIKNSSTIASFLATAGLEPNNADCRKATVSAQNPGNLYLTLTHT